MKLYETLVLEEKSYYNNKITFNLSHINLGMNVFIEMSGFETYIRLDREQFSELLLFMNKEVEKHMKYLKEG